jgi:hypothetical protein
MTVEYKKFDVVREGVNLMAARTPRVQKDVPRAFGDHLSSMLNNNEWNIDPTNGQPLSHDGKTLEQVLEHWLSTRPFCLAAVAPIDTSGACWLEGNLTLQGQRLRELERFTGSAKAGMVLLEEEAASYGVKVFTTEKSEGKVDAKAGADKKTGGKDASTNPWSEKFHGDAMAARIAVISRQGGPARAASLAKSCNVDLAGRALPAGKSYR